MKAKGPVDNKSDKVEFDVINREIGLLMKRLRAKNVCPCCVAQGMMYRGAYLHLDVTGPEETVGLCLDIADVIDDGDDTVMPDGTTQH